MRDDEGQDLVEYALVAVLIAVGAVASLKNIASGTGAVFTAVSMKIKTPV